MPLRIGWLTENLSPGPFSFPSGREDYQGRAIDYPGDLLHLVREVRKEERYRGAVPNKEAKRRAAQLLRVS